MRNRREVSQTIDKILIPYADCIAWEDYGPNGNPCYDPSYFASVAEEEEASYTLAAVNLEMKKDGARHKTLAKEVAAQTGNTWVTFPWLRDAVTRLLSDCTYDDLCSMVHLSQAVRNGMKAKGLKEIHTIKEALG